MAGLRYKGHIYAGVASYGNANEVNYDNTDSGLTATNVQAALDEVSANIDDLGADDISYDNTDSGLTATNVQDAVNEINSNKSCNKYYSWFQQPAQDITGTYTNPNTFFSQTFTMPYNGYVLIWFHQIMKTSNYTSTVQLIIDGNVVCNAGTNCQTPIYVCRSHRIYLTSGSHTIQLKLVGQQGNETVTPIGTLPGYNGHGVVINIE